jgi:hypothetical protein
VVRKRSVLRAVIGEILSAVPPGYELTLRSQAPVIRAR